MPTPLADLYLIRAIAKRAITVCPEAPLDYQSTCMDLEAAHCEIGLHLEDLKNADDSNLLHDVLGIHRHLNRKTAKLTHSFLPRFALPSSALHVPTTPPWLLAP